MKRRWKPREAAERPAAARAAIADVDTGETWASTKKASTAASDDCLNKLDLGRHWFTLGFRDANVGFLHRQRRQRFYAHITAMFIAASWMIDLFAINFSLIDTADTVMVLITALRVFVPMLSTGVVGYAWSTGARTFRASVVGGGLFEPAAHHCRAVLLLLL